MSSAFNKLPAAAMALFVEKFLIQMYTFMALFLSVNFCM